MADTDKSSQLILLNTLLTQIQTQNSRSLEQSKARSLSLPSDGDQSAVCKLAHILAENPKLSIELSIEITKLLSSSPESKKDGRISSTTVQNDIKPELQLNQQIQRNFTVSNPRLTSMSLGEALGVSQRSHVDTSSILQTSSMLGPKPELLARTHHPA